MIQLSKYCRHDKDKVVADYAELIRRYKSLTFFHRHLVFAERIYVEIAAMEDLDSVLNRLSEAITTLIIEKDSHRLLFLLTNFMADALGFEVERGFVRAMELRTARTFFHEWTTGEEQNFIRLVMYPVVIMLSLFALIGTAAPLGVVLLTFALESALIEIGTMLSTRENIRSEPIFNPEIKKNNQVERFREREQYRETHGIVHHSSGTTSLHTHRDETIHNSSAVIDLVNPFSTYPGL